MQGTKLIEHLHAVSQTELPQFDNAEVNSAGAIGVPLFRADSLDRLSALLVATGEKLSRMLGYIVPYPRRLGRDSFADARL